MEDLIGILIPIISKYPIVASILMVVGGLRVVIKPIMSALRSYVEYTDSPNDNVKLDKIESSKLYKTLSYILDYLASVKLPK